MHRPHRPNRQQNQHQSRGNTERGRGPRGRAPPRGGRGTHPNNNTPQRPPSFPRHENPPVPPHTSIHPSTPVSIILKPDQPTGHQVTGLVAEVLTRGNHPRGVKVRLRDGRVGRVQKIVGVEEGERGERLVGGEGAGLGRDGGGSGGSRGGGGGGRGRFFQMVKDVREEDEYLFDEERMGGMREMGSGGLFKALEEADRKYEEGRGWGGEVGERPPEEMRSEIVKCPVCGVFEGDERAVGFHVEEHFG